MDVTHMFSKIMMSNCNGGKDNEINQTQKEILRDVGRTIVHMVTLDGATIEGARGMIDVMIRALDVGRVSKLSSAYKFPVSKVDESTYLITDKDIHRCKACGETGTLSPKLWKKRRDCPDDFVYPNLCTPCYEHGREVPRWQRSEYLAAHPRPSIGASSSQSVLNVSGALTASSRGRATSSVSAAAVWPNDVSAAAALPNAQVSSPSAASVSATSTGLPSAQASPQVSSSTAAASVSVAVKGPPSAQASPLVSSSAAAAASESAASTEPPSARASSQVSSSAAASVSTTASTVSHSTRVTRAPAAASTISSSARVKPAPAAVAASTVPPVLVVRAKTEVKSVSPSLTTQAGVKEKQAHPRPVSVRSPSLTGSSTPGVLTVGSGTGVDEEAVQRDLETMAIVERLEAASLLAFCEEGTSARTDFDFATRGRWRPEDDAILTDALNKFASGSFHRWGNITTMMIRGRLAAWDRLGASFCDPHGPTVELALLKLGDVLRATKDEAGALEAYTEGTRRRPTSFSWYLRMAKLFVENGRLDEAEQISLRGIKTVNDTECLEKFVGWIRRLKLDPKAVM